MNSKNGPNVKVSEEFLRALDMRIVKGLAGLTGRLAGYTFDAWRDGIQPKAKELALSFFERPRSLVFWSETYGSGKSFAACSILDRWLRLDVTRVDPGTKIPAYTGGMQPMPNGGPGNLGGVIVATGDLLSRIRATYDQRPEIRETEAEIVGLMQRTPLLVLDDVGYEDISAHARGILYRIINARYAKDIPIIITTNRSPQELIGSDQGLGGASVSRLRQMGEFLHLEEHDYRV